MKVIGLMSGTSMDGIDAALCEITGKPPALQAQVLTSRSIPFSKALREELLTLCNGGTVDAICRMNARLGERFAQAALDVAGDISTVDLISSHGQTVWHDVDSHGQVTSTLQIGSAAVIAEQTSVTTVSNFRERDVAAGGQGAPLTAYVDWLLLRHPRAWRAVQNIGGMGNVSFLPPLTDTATPLIAFDTGPGNVLIDWLAGALTHNRQTYDEDGALAAEGTPDASWVTELLAHPYFQQAPPRTTGRELFGAAMAQALLTEGRRRGLRDVDVVATVTLLSARSIATAYRQYAPHPIDEVILGGGGAHNPTLVAMLGAELPGVRIVPHEAIGLSTDFKEALVFAVLGYETWHNRMGSLPSQTGARHPSVLGQITPGDNYAKLLHDTWSFRTTER